MGKLKSLKLMRVAFSIFFCLFAYALSAQTINVKGKVKDSGGESIIGANVHVLGTTSGTTTDVNGDFSLQCDAKWLSRPWASSVPPKPSAIQLPPSARRK